MNTRLIRAAIAIVPLLPHVALAQGPWAAALSVGRKALGVGECSAVLLNLSDPATKEWPRGPNGSRVSMADFDFTVSAPAERAAVGKYDGANSFAVCACPKAQAGSVATVTATYPSRTIAPKVRVTSVSFSTTTSVPIVAGSSSGNAPGCDPPTPTTAMDGGGALWTVTVTPPAALPIGSCGAVGLTLRDSTGKDWPRNPVGARVSISDFDLSATTPNGADAVGKYDGASSFSACACQTGTVGEMGTVTATYPARALAAKARVPGIALKAVAPFNLAAARGSANPPGCGDKQAGQVAIAGTPLPPPMIVAPATTPAQLPTNAAPMITEKFKTGIVAPPMTTAPPTTMPPLANPTGFTAVDRGGGGVDWAWQPVPGAAKYRIDGTGLPSTGLFTTSTHNAFPHIPGGPGTWKVTSVFPGNLSDTTTGPTVSLVVHVLPPRSQHWLVKNNGAGSLAQVQVPANPFDPAHPCTPMASNQPTLNDCTQYDVDHHTINQGINPGDLSSAPYDLQSLGWLTVVPVDDWSKNGFVRWLDVGIKLWYEQFQSQQEAVYGNPLDLGVGRRAFCVQEMKGPPHPGYKTVCYATAHGATPGTPGFNDSATITHPAPSPGSTDFILAMMIIKDQTGTTFLVSNGTDLVLPTVRLDTEGPKFVPFACISCHGGTYNAATRKVDGSSLLPLDPGLLSFASASDKAAQEEKIRKINQMITVAQPNSAITAYLNGLYNGAIGTPGTAAQPDYVPSGWSQQSGFYRQIVRPHCAMCHLAAPAQWNFASYGNFLGNKGLIYADVCGAHTMPHAEVPYKSFWLKNTGALYLPGLLAAQLGYPSC
jgi:hypothetical protein